MKFQLLNIGNFKCSCETMHFNLACCCQIIIFPAVHSHLRIFSEGFLPDLPLVPVLKEENQIYQNSGI